MSDQLCACGAQPGYPHRHDCPRPLFNPTDAQFEQWEKEWLAKSQITTGGIVKPTPMRDIMDKVFAPDIRMMVNDAGLVVGVWPLTQAGVERLARENATYDSIASVLSGLTIESVDVGDY
jgi:hypothetical protein